jgi:hypothetical protein
VCFGVIIGITSASAFYSYHQRVLLIIIVVFSSCLFTEAHLLVTMAGIRSIFIFIFDFRFFTPIFIYISFK